MTKDIIFEVRPVDYERLLFLKKNDEVFKDEDPGEIISGLIISFIGVSFAGIVSLDRLGPTANARS